MHRLDSHLALLQTDRVALRDATRDRLGNSKQRAGLKEWLSEQSDGRCYQCGKDGRELVMAHAISALTCSGYARAGHRGGYLPGNIFLSCVPCNKWNREEANLGASDLVLADLVPLAWPRFNRYGVMA